ncbi:hypothetical protein CONLIGDRAFT_43258 [Coniochaeta ligniaria NRRL 30616]|uniref:Uncharacterized protein n=1 Tax=Coniochaeta ligniaria NRRL 30616 TaxID=1408157 RepID=A0A1J7J6Q5_9PEZI|nr:hypothetical protein CONLIGDRAFT_43258 [Coniochaeta ligniaria NRRL 30616]
MADTSDVPPPTFRCESPSPDNSPAAALGPRHTGMDRCLSTASSASHGSATTDASHMRESLGSDISAYSRQSSASYGSSRLSDISNIGSQPSLSRMSSRNSLRTVSGTNRRRGYMRPTGTDFAASARSRESVLSLGSIAHLQYYFARTGLLDGKGGQLARKRKQQAGQTLDLSALDTASFKNARLSSSDVDSSYASMGSSPDLTLSTQGGFTSGNSSLGVGPIVESPIDDHHQDDEYYSDDYEEGDEHMLPPTASTYHHREKPLPKPPSITELKADLASALDEAAKALSEGRTNRQSPPPDSPLRQRREPNSPQPKTGGWHEIQGMHILDVMTLAIRAAKVYYTAHENPERLDAIKTERQLRSELLGVMDILKRMATRGFAGGLRDDEAAAMDGWILSVRDMLAAEEAVEAMEAAERASWTWLDDEGWEGRELEREHAFLETLLAGGSGIVNSAAATGVTAGAAATTVQPPVTSPTALTPPDIPASFAPLSPTTPTTPTLPPSLPDPPLPPWTPLDRTSPQPTPFLTHLQNGIRLVHLHNCAVRRSRRRFGAIPTWHTDTQKPYRAADNLRYWLKAAELRWEVHLKLDALAVVYGTDPAAWVDFEDAVRQWCGRVREEIIAEVRGM